MGSHQRAMRKRETSPTRRWWWCKNKTSGATRDLKHFFHVLVQISTNLCAEEPRLIDRQNRFLCGDRPPSAGASANGSACFDTEDILGTHSGCNPVQPQDGFDKWPCATLPPTDGRD
jgi:hypothetical protein